MALYLDPPSGAFSVNLLALGFITDFQGSFTLSPDTIGGFPVSKVGYESDATDFGVARIKAITKVLPDVIVLSAQGSDFVLPDGTPITSVAGAVLVDSFGQILVWDQGYCHGQGYHVFNTAGQPIEQESYLTIFHELSHAYHNALGSSPANLVASEALAIQETNLLRSQLGLELRDPGNHNGGCGPGPQEPWWKKFLVDLVGALGVFAGSSSAPTGVPKVESVEKALRAELKAQSDVLDRGASRWREALEGPVSEALKAFYPAVALVLDSSMDRARQTKALMLILSELSKKDLHRKPANVLLPSRVGQRPPGQRSDTALEAYASAPYWMIWRAHDKLFVEGESVGAVLRDFTRAVEAWIPSLRQVEVEPPGQVQLSVPVQAATLLHRTF